MLQFGLRLLVKGKRKRTQQCHHDMPAQEERERHAGRATSTFCQRMNIKGNKGGERMELQGKDRVRTDTMNKRVKVERGHELVC